MPAHARFGVISAPRHARPLGHSFANGSLTDQQQPLSATCLPCRSSAASATAFLPVLILSIYCPSRNTVAAAWFAGRRGVVLAAVLVAAAGLFDITYAQVVGGGAVGCPLAATLSKGFSVLLLERGGVPYDQPLPPPMLPIHRAFSLSKGVSMLLLERGGVPYDQDPFVLFVMHEDGCAPLTLPNPILPFPPLPPSPAFTFSVRRDASPYVLSMRASPSVYRREAFPYVLSTRASVPFRSEDGVWNRRGIGWRW
ncbi:unnamed protein product [Closterium sp. NIES-64]|nr:unnamed protein product [Closterium sp. NIES-64]